MNKSLKLTEIENTLYDVVVVGGGMAGTFAAVAAAREGASVLLVEKNGYLGGAATAGLVHPFMPYFERPGGKIANAGLFTELLRRLHEIGASPSDKSCFFNDQLLKVTLDRLLVEAGVSMLFGCMVGEVDMDGESIKKVHAYSPAGKISLSAKIFVDASGDADLSAFAGMDCRVGRPKDHLCNPMTLNFNLANVDWSRWDKYEADKNYRELKAQGKIRNNRRDILSMTMQVGNMMHLNSTRIVGKDATDPVSYTEAELEGREQMLELYNFLKNYCPGLEDCELVSAGAEIGVRESRRVIGHYILTEEDVLGVKHFEDSICRATYNVDIHNPEGEGTFCRYLPHNTYYTIPYRCLVPLGSKNLLVAGRPISATHEAHSSLRVIPSASCIGQAAGTAAALSAKHSVAPENLDVDELRNVLVNNGALV
ncbi:MAG: FAD-dependent oxidoreductase [Clostridia bacterium]|nr:FAD-dependent oxidoreductase [Clostridia bacterium]